MDDDRLAVTGRLRHRHEGLCRVAKVGVRDDTVIGAWNVRVRKTAQRLVTRRRDLFPLTARTFFAARAATGRAAQGKRYRAGQQASSRYFHSSTSLFDMATRPAMPTNTISARMTTDETSPR
ncbi:hypothetical protein CGZ91_12605 [Parenemella sanctibonifatiensis]|uniref:Uncharacterized protein n=1 Tax=Parenemella sanctibonifatiensis TaxID=2016505 RepID=A0A255EC32_9ACTN|nr:hypothetical protein CGZ91_12605 [Parenemella sanctibonifatiensis]